jgi:hypothetical protein
MHKSMLAGFIIDCQTKELKQAAEFWGSALGMTPQILDKEDGGDKYIPLVNSLRLEISVQSVEHPSRVHLDIAADDIEAEKTRLEKLGAKYIEHLKTWIIMEAPTGQRFCIVRSKNREGFDAKASAWND